MRPSGPAAFTEGFRSSLDYTKAAAAGTGVGAYTGLSAAAGTCVGAYTGLSALM